MIFLKVSLGVLYRMGETKLTINLPRNKNNTLYIIVENLGRLNFGDNLLDSKACFLNIILLQFDLLMKKNFKGQFARWSPAGRKGVGKLDSMLDAKFHSVLSSLSAVGPQRKRHQEAVRRFGVKV